VRDARERASIVDRDPKFTIATKSVSPNRFRRFARKFGFGERRRGANAVIAKIFLLPKFATQSPRARLFDGIAESQ
jgi:hypothetical protein